MQAIFAWVKGLIMDKHVGSRDEISVEYTKGRAAADIFDQLLILRELAVSRKMPMLAYLIDMAAVEAQDEAKKEE